MDGSSPMSRRKRDAPRALSAEERAGVDRLSRSGGVSAAAVADATAAPAAATGGTSTQAAPVAGRSWQRTRSWQGTRSWRPTGEGVRLRKGGRVHSSAPDAEAKKR